MATPTAHQPYKQLVAGGRYDVHRIRDGWQEKGETAGMQEHHDGNLVIYPRRLDLALYVCAQTVVFGTFIAGIVILFLHDSQDMRASFGLLGAGALAILGLYFIGSEAFRLVIRRPAIIVNDEGILDNWSLLYGGVGLVRWSEIDILSRYVRKTPASNQQFFVIFPDESVLARRSRWQRFVSGGIRYSIPGTITISCMALALSPQELLTEIEHRFAHQLHAHRVLIDRSRKPPPQVT